MTALQSDMIGALIESEAWLARFSRYLEAETQRLQSTCRRYRESHSGDTLEEQ